MRKRAEFVFKQEDNGHFHIITYSDRGLANMPPINFSGHYLRAARDMIGATVKIGSRKFQIIETRGFKGESRYPSLYGQTPGTVYANPNMGTHLPLVRVGQPGPEIGDCVLIRGMRLVDGPEIDITGKGIKKARGKEKGSVEGAPGSVARVMGFTVNGQRKTLQAVGDPRNREFELVDYEEQRLRREAGK